MNLNEYPISVNEHVINETQLLFSGEGSHSRVWCDRTTAYKVPKLENKHKSYAAVFRDAFFQQLIDNFECELTFGRWMHHDCVPILCNRKMRPLSISEGVPDCGRLIRCLVSNLHKVHSYGLRHGDIHPHNVCQMDWGGEQVFTFVDFENAADHQTATCLQHVKLPVMCAPELLDPGQISDSTEVWSLGATVASICLKRRVNPKSQAACRSIIEECEDCIPTFLRDTIQMDPCKRLKIDELVSKYAQPSTVLPIQEQDDVTVDWFDVSRSLDALIHCAFKKGAVIRSKQLNSMIKCVMEAKLVRQMFS